MATRFVLSRQREFVLGNFQVRRFINAQAVETAVELERSSTSVSENEVQNKGIPFLFLPHTVKKAYIVHEAASTNLPNTFDKYKWLTKTISSPIIPGGHKPLETIGTPCHQNFHDSILQTTAFQKSPKNKNNKRYIPERLKFSLFSNLINFSIMENNNKEHFQPENSMICYEPILETHWVRNYKFYQTKFRPTFVLKTRTGFEMIEEPQELDPNDIEHIPGPYDPYALNTYRRPIVHLLNRPCLDNFKFSPLKHCHTTLMINNRLRGDEQLYSLGVFTMFSQLAAQAQTTGVHHGTVLDQPIVTQGVITNGHQIVFMVYQLNSLDMLDDKGVWNRCWYTPVMEMYQQKLSGPWNVYEETKRGESLLGYNEDICKYFVSFFGKDTLC